MEICAKCGCNIGVVRESAKTMQKASSTIRDYSTVQFCRICQSAQHVKTVAVPGVLKLLTAELTSMNIKSKFTIT